MNEFYLIIDTTIRGAGVGLVERSGVGVGELVATAFCYDSYSSGSIIPSLTKSVLDSGKVTIDSLNGILVAKGPGTFTGIKIGLSYVAGISGGGTIPLMGVSSLESYVRQQQAETPVSCFLPATKSHGFASIFLPDGSIASYIVECSEKLSLFTENRVQEVSTDLVAESSAVIVLPWGRAKDCLEKIGVDTVEVKWPEMAMRFMNVLAREAIFAEEASFGGAMPEPFYLRKSAPEERLELVFKDKENG